ncbi:hypothetical protein MKW94_010925 [Papaver nudicaule]|uniref:Uncharacterized protein n=1 Tax=Papaver nudicaule TaxID=74823 RepID=A0AA41S2U8_PAPNU|nr:hypothetical protein [Papaver nudicaule]
MEEKEDQTTIQISNPNIDELSCAQQQSTLPAQTYHARRAMSKGVQGTLSNDIDVGELVTNRDTTYLKRYFHSFRGSDGTVYYGYVTPRGLAVFQPDLLARQQQWEQERNQFSNMSTSLRFKELHLHFSNKNTDNPQAKYVPFIFLFVNANPIIR